MTTAADSNSNADVPVQIDMPALRQGNDAAWAAAYPQLFPIARAAAFARLEDWHAAEDVAAATLLLLCQRKPALGVFDEARAWCAFVANRHAISLHRKMNAAKRGDGRTARLCDVSLADVPTVVPHEQLRAIIDVESLVGGLSEHERAVVLARFIHGASSQEIAALHGVADSSVRGTTGKALRTLRRFGERIPAAGSTALLVFAMMRAKAWLAPVFAISS